MNTDHRILIAMPCLSTVPVATMTSLLNMDKNGMCTFAVTQGSLVYDARNYLYNEAKTRKCDLILWLDSDMVFPQDALTRLLQDMEEHGADYVSGLYFTRKKPIIPTLAKSIKWEQDNVTGIVSHQVDTFYDYPRNKIFKIAGSGFGCCLTSTRMIAYVAGIFNSNPFDPLPGLGEDYSFCWKANDLGIDLYCDSSVKCGHVGEAVITEEIYNNTQETMKEG